MRLHLNCVDWPDPEKQYQPEYSKIENQIFQTQRVHVDNHQYGHCRFVNCTFVYSGGPFGFYECQIEGGFYFAPTGSARRTVELALFFREYQGTLPKFPG